MLNRFEDELEIFDNFIVDKNLPKHKTKEESNLKMDSGNTLAVMDGWNDSSMDSNDPKEKKRFAWFKNLFKKKEKPTYTVKEFFTHIKNTQKEIDNIEKRAEGYQEMLESAMIAGQTSLVEEIKDNIDIVRAESQLLANGLVTVITEEQVIDFYKESEKGIRLDWIKNFTRLIPSEIIKTKKRLDELCIFDNYVVMHYDPNKKSYKMTKAEKEKRKDPILFGVIKNSRKLYFIGDWEDEVCDLTLDDLVGKFGKDAISQNDINVNIKIGKHEIVK